MMMNRRCIAFGLITFLATTLFAGPAGAQPRAQSERNLREIKERITNFGVPGGPRMDVGLRDKTRLKGQISDVGNLTFTLSDNKTGSISTVKYTNVKTVSKAGHRAVMIPILAVVGLASYFIIQERV